MWMYLFLTFAKNMVAKGENSLQAGTVSTENLDLR